MELLSDDTNKFSLDTTRVESVQSSDLQLTELAPIQLYRSATPESAVVFGASRNLGVCDLPPYSSSHYQPHSSGQIVLPSQTTAPLISHHLQGTHTLGPVNPFELLIEQDFQQACLPKVALSPLVAQERLTQSQDFYSPRAIELEQQAYQQQNLTLPLTSLSQNQLKSRISPSSLQVPQIMGEMTPFPKPVSSLAEPLSLAGVEWSESTRPSETVAAGRRRRQTAILEFLAQGS
jgi:hypothetical protein